MCLCVCVTAAGYMLVAVTIGNGISFRLLACLVEMMAADEILVLKTSTNMAFQ